MLDLDKTPITPYRFKQPVFGEMISQEALLGRGGMGEVYRIVKDRQGFAVKVVRPDLLETNPDHFQSLALAEARIAYAAGQVSDALPKVYEYDSIPDYAPNSKRHLRNVAIRMDLIGGTNVDQLLQDQKSPPDIRDLLKVFYDTLQCQQALIREIGIVHPDYKPGNVVYETKEKPGLGKAVLLDLGVTKLLEWSPLRYSVPQHIIDILDAHSGGTMEYTSPEELRGKNPKREELLVPIATFKAGLVGYELLTAKSLYNEAAQKMGILDFRMKNHIIMMSIMHTAIQRGVLHTALDDGQDQVTSNLETRMGKSTPYQDIKDLFKVLHQSIEYHARKRPSLSQLQDATQVLLEDLILFEGELPLRRL
ncbi:hypothetical protein HYV86_03240 [Candidatus Woesearchaeota archaeon]|nr:hypothetical protein [Candidatus Woesearchaeota archaeon]